MRAVKTLAALLLALVMCVPALAQERPGRERQVRKESRERVREERREAHRERSDRDERRRFSREERQQLRQDLLDANREMKGRR